MKLRLFGVRGPELQKQCQKEISGNITVFLQPGAEGVFPLQENSKSPQLTREAQCSSGQCSRLGHYTASPWGPRKCAFEG